MNYQETLDFLFSQVPMFQNLGAGAYKPGLDTTLALARHWGDPHRRLRSVIHVAGTNGKGSSAHTMAAILRSAGYRTALYTSPHLLDFRERIRVDGEMISEQAVIDFVDEYRRTPALTALHPTFFELTTIMAFKYFVDCDADVAVIETGLGGRLDCTNIVSPDLCVITNISLDHTALLGHTETEIAHEKAGIIKPHIPIVIGRADGDVRNVFADTAARQEAPVTFAQDRLPYSSFENHADHIIYRGTRWGDIRGQLCGLCQPENAATILTAVEILAEKFTKIDAHSVREGFARVCRLTGLMGRWMEVRKEPVRIICDTGHNVGGWTHLGPQLQEIADKGRLHAVLGFVNDKDVSAIVEQWPRNAVYYFATPSVARGRAASDTAAEALRHGISGTSHDTVEAAFMAAESAAAPGDTVFVGGSTFVVADFLKAFRETT
ncbi:MAG: bifunctional folylpolyglutamate synthase/dihydrofolate synthase [Muribaculaceae bacterium]|nr:bifunctional folylpolyglutamate synthase/dihydrofolate synthase [Muribaculaceae bacterium]